MSKTPVTNETPTTNWRRWDDMPVKHRDRMVELYDEGKSILRLRNQIAHEFGIRYGEETVRRAVQSKRQLRGHGDIYKCISPYAYELGKLE